MGLVYYRMLFTQHRGSMGLKTPWPPGRKPRSCADARYLSKVWTLRARQARKAKAWYLAHTLKDYAYWPRAVRESQRVYPGTEGWLLSCSEAESNHTHWVGHAGRPYSAWLRDSDTVGGYMQFRFSTFKGMWHQGYDYAISRGFRFPTHLKRNSYSSDFEWKDEAWQSALGQAIAAGWARFTGNDNTHWIASWGNGCR